MIRAGLVAVLAAAVFAEMPVATAAERSARQGPLRLVFAAELPAVAGADAASPAMVRQLYSVEPSGRRFARLPAALPHVWEAVPSPDGRRLLVQLVGGLRPPQIWVLSADGRQRMRLAEGSSPSWAPDSQRVAYVGGPAAPGVHVIGIDGRGHRRLTRNPEIVAVRWSPDGRRFLVFTAGSGGDIVSLLARGRLAPFVSGGATSAEWSPDGRWIAYESSVGGIWVVDAAGRRHRRLAASGRQPEWSPDGRRIAFVEPNWSNNGIRVRSDGGIRVVEVATRRVRALTRDRGATFDLAWSPLGGEIAYRTRGDVRVVTLRGRMRVVAANVAAGPPRWIRPPRGARYLPLAAVGPVATPGELLSRRPIDRIAAGGGGVAFATCGDVGVWEPRNRRARMVAFDTLCDRRVYGLALAGRYVAYASQQGGNQVAGELRRSDWRDPGVDNLLNPLLPTAGYLLGDSSVLVFSSWETCGEAEPQPPPCGDQGIASQSVWMVPPVESPVPWSCGPCVAVVSAAERVEPLALDAGRVVVRRAGRALELYGTDGRLLRSFPFARDEALGAVLSAGDLVVLVRGELRRYDAETGALVRSFPLPDASGGGFCGRRSCPPVELRLLDTARGLVAYILRGDLHLLRLVDGRDIVVARATDATLEPEGLSYAYEAAGPWPGRIRFMPFDRLPLAP